MTNQVPRKYAQISYTLDDDEEEASEEEFGAEKPKAKTAKQESGHENGNGIMVSRTRGGNKQHDQKEQIEENLRKDQDKLLDEKLEELKRRFEKNEIEMDSKKQKQKDMGKIQSYSSIKKFPADLKRGHLYVDDKNDTILLPISQD